ncbi:hypothetical protein K523DRAFT_283056 [Schizophyllum commune Tattone D]|nr:hypothetical protein K523DRAFT_283056 [Schizophyllum commune Tattone D]
MAGISASEQNRPEAPHANFAARESSTQRPGQRLAEVVQRVMKGRQEPRHVPARCEAPHRSMDPEPNATGAETKTIPDAEPANNMGPESAQGMCAASTSRTGRQDTADRAGSGQSEQPRYTSSDVDYERKYAPDAYGEELNKNARVYSVYNDEAQIADGEMVRSLNGTLDVLLVFAGLFSAVVTTFVAQSSQALSPDYAQITASLMYELVRIQRAATSGTPPDVPMSPLSFGSRTTQTTDLWVNGLWLTSLTFALLTALVSVLAKQWIQHYSSLFGRSPRIRAHLRQYRFEGFERWKVRAIIGFLPVLLTVALLLFFAGLIVYVIPMDSTMSLVIIGFSAGILLAYSITTALPVFVTHCAYKTPLADYMITVGHPVLHYTLILPFQLIRLLCDFVYRYIGAEGMQRRGLRQLAMDCRSAWYRDSPWTLKEREGSIIVKWKSQVLTTDVLDWLTYSSLNASAAKIAVQASSALKLDGDPQTIWAYSWRSNDYLQELDRDCATSTLTAEHVAIAERLARVTMHRSRAYLIYVERVWSLDLWERMYMHRDRIDSPAHKAMLCLVLWIPFCDDENPLSDSSVVRRASDACSLLDISSSAPKLHPVIWRELDRLARTCLLLCDEQHSPKGRDEAGDHRADAIHEDVIDAELHAQYRPSDDNFDPYASTAITLDEYCEGCEWVDGREEFQDNLEKLKRALSSHLAKLGNEKAGAERAKDATGTTNRRLLEDTSEAQLGRDSADEPARHDSRGGVGEDEGGLLQVVEVGTSARAAVDSCGEDMDGRGFSDAHQRDEPVAADDRSSVFAHTPQATSAPDSFDAGGDDNEPRVVVHLEQRDTAPNTPAGSVEDSANLHTTQSSAAAAAVAEAHVLRESVS